MGVNLRDLVVRREISLSELSGKKIAIDAFNILYQFLSAIRQRDGSPLQDSHGKITSHLSGLFYRTFNLLEEGIKPVFVFDGISPELKHDTKQERYFKKEIAQKKYDDAVKSGDIDAQKKYAQQTSKLTHEIISESRELIKAMGLPIVQAVSEGEAQAAYMAKKAMVYAVVSQDYDALLFGAPFLIRNLTVSKRKKLPGREIYQEIKPEIIALAEVLNTHSIDIDQLINIAILIGTDFNHGIDGIGPKKALKAVKERKERELLSQIPRAEKILNLFKNPAVSTGITLSWSEPNKEKIKEILCKRHDFSEARIDAALERLKKKLEQQKQSNLQTFI